MGVRHKGRNQRPVPGRPSRTVDPLLPLDRQKFHEAVMGRSHGLCVLCGAPAVDAHHVLDRRLWSDGTQGLMLGNGAAVCGPCHVRCETTQVSVQVVRQQAGIVAFPLPPCLDPLHTYDKWGNRVLPDGTRRWGPLRDDGVERVLRRGGFLHLFPQYGLDPSVLPGVSL